MCSSSAIRTMYTAMSWNLPRLDLVPQLVVPKVAMCFKLRVSFLHTLQVQPSTSLKDFRNAQKNKRHNSLRVDLKSKKEKPDACENSFSTLVSNCNLLVRTRGLPVD
jgi:hypothetical protein